VPTGARFFKTPGAIYQCVEALRVSRGKFARKMSKQFEFRDTAKFAKSLDVILSGVPWVVRQVRKYSTASVRMCHLPSPSHRNQRMWMTGSVRLSVRKLESDMKYGDVQEQEVQEIRHGCCHGRSRLVGSRASMSSIHTVTV